MTQLEQHWDRLHLFLIDHGASRDHVALCRNVFFSGAVTILSIMADLNRSTPSDEEFDRLIDELFDEATNTLATARKQSLSAQRH